MPFKCYLYHKAVMINIFVTAMYHQTVSQRKYERGDESKETNVFPLFTNRCKKQQQKKSIITGLRFHFRSEVFYKLTICYV